MITAIICAAGKGTRAGFSENKILRELNGLPVLCYSLSAFSRAGADEILVACRKEDEPHILPLLSPYPNARCVRGGAFRAESVFLALKEARGDIVLVHDAARPYLSQKVIEVCIESVTVFGSGVCALPSTDTTVLAEDGKIISAPARESVFTVQTPQGFYREELLAAYERAFAEKRAQDFTDDSGIYAHYVAPPRLFLGDRTNKKLTYPEDFLPAERVGFGVDTHAFVVTDSASSAFLQKAQMRCDRSSSSRNFPTGNFGSPIPEDEAIPLVNFITLGGVRVPSEKILKAHSDGDVLVHALMDALLSAAGLRDIGYYFPDTDRKYAGANSMHLLEEVVKLLASKGLTAKNVSISVLAETPRLAPYIENMKENLAEALSLPLSAIGIAAGTNERLGYVGEKKGITAYATVLLK